MIKLEHVSKYYESFLLNDISVEIPSGQLVGIVGQSGSGKSTLLKLLNLTEVPDQGNIIMADKEISTLPKNQIRKVKHDIGMIFQDYHLLNNLTVLENIFLPLKLLGDKDKTKACRWLDKVGLLEYQEKYPSQLSGGQKQRVAVARALVNKPKLILLDEATSALDDHTTHLILELIKEVHQDYQPTICFISHELDSVKYLCERCLVLDKGNLVADIQVNQSSLDTLTETYKEKAIRRLET